MVAYAGYLCWLLRDIRRDREGQPAQARTDKPKAPADPKRPSGWRALAKLLGAVAVIGLASHLLVTATRLLGGTLQQAAGWDHAATTGVLSVIVIAAATSAPDAFASLAAARRGEGSMAVANAIGSNTFDILVCLGLPAAAMGGRPVAAIVRISGGFLLVSAVLVLGIGLHRPVLERRHGIFLVGFYAVFVLIIGAFFAWTS